MQETPSPAFCRHTCRLPIQAHHSLFLVQTPPSFFCGSDNVRLPQLVEAVRLLAGNSEVLLAPPCKTSTINNTCVRVYIWSGPPSHIMLCDRIVRTSSKSRAGPCVYTWYTLYTYIGRLLSQAPKILMLLSKTLADLLKLQNFGHTSLTCSTSLWHTVTPSEFFPVGQLRRWWSPRSRENDRWRPATSEPLNRIVCRWFHYKRICENYRVKALNANFEKFLENGFLL